MSALTSQVELTVAVVGSPKPIVAWSFKEGFEIHADNPRFEFYQSSGDSFTMALKEARLTDAGDVKVRASNRAGAASSQAILRVHGEQREEIAILCMVRPRKRWSSCAW